mmetsp:Transcript_27843/g.72045  ORF Transcript_27843/g.72045 Transcript_27843/m.72045 type:complete len:415 (+) Transcript_27843:275-1519(+)
MGSVDRQCHRRVQRSPGDSTHSNDTHEQGEADGEPKHVAQSPRAQRRHRQHHEAQQERKQRLRQHHTSPAIPGRGAQGEGLPHHSRVGQRPRRTPEALGEHVAHGIPAGQAIRSTQQCRQSHRWVEMSTAHIPQAINHYHQRSRDRERCSLVPRPLHHIQPHRHHQNEGPQELRHQPRRQAADQPGPERSPLHPLARSHGHESEVGEHAADELEGNVYHTPPHALQGAGYVNGYRNSGVEAPPGDPPGGEPTCHHGKADSNPVHLVVRLRPAVPLRRRCVQHGEHQQEGVDRLYSPCLHPPEPGAGDEIEGLLVDHGVAECCQQPSEDLNCHVHAHVDPGLVALRPHRERNSGVEMPPADCAKRVNRYHQGGRNGQCGKHRRPPQHVAPHREHQHVGAQPLRYQPLHGGHACDM